MYSRENESAVLQNFIMPIAVLYQIVCLNLVYSTFFVLDGLSSEIFVSLPLRSYVFPLFYENNVLTNSMYKSNFVFNFDYLSACGRLALWLILSLTISYFVFIAPFTNRVLILVTKNCFGDHLKLYSPG